MSDLKKQALLIDGDDTLWKAQELYQKAERDFRERLATVVGISPDTIQARFDEINSALASSTNVQADQSAHHPLSAGERYPLAMEQTYAYFASQRGLAVDPQVQEKIRSIAKEAFTLTPVLIEGAREVFSSLAEQYDLIFYSAGEEQIQRGRLDRLGLARFFDSRIWVVPQKNEDELRKLLANFSLTTQNTWVIGNSPRFDISPALRLGIRAIWVYSDLWDNEKEELVPLNANGGLAPYATVFHLREITSMLEAFPPRDPTEARLRMYSAVLQDQMQATARRQNLTSVFIGLNTVALSGLAFLLASVKLDRSVYFDIVTALLIVISAFIINRIYRKAMTKYDDLVTVSAVYLRTMEASLKEELSVRLPGSNEAGTGFHEGVMTVIGGLRMLGRSKRHWWHNLVPPWRRNRGETTLHLTPEERAALLGKLKIELEAKSDELIEKFAANVPYNVEKALANLFVRFFRYTALALVVLGVLFLFGIIQAHWELFSQVPAPFR